MGRSLLRCAAVLVGGALLIACGEAGSPSDPSPQAVDTAEAIARDVKITANFSTTPTPEDAEREVEIVLDGRVFGNGDVGIIFAHMRPADQTSWFPLATRLANSGGYTVLTFDFRGYGESTGEKEFNRVDTDLQAALDYMHDDLGIDRVFLVGASMGGTASLIIAARQPVEGVVALSALAFFQEIDAVDTVGAVKAPKLFLVSEDDVPAMRSLDQFILQAHEPADEEIYPGDAHGTDLFAEPFSADVQQRIIDFIEDHTQSSRARR